MYNSITLIGNLGADPDIKQTSKGGNYALLSIATHKKIKGEKLTERKRRNDPRPILFNFIS